MRIHEIISPVNEGVISTLAKGAVRAGKNAYSRISGRAVNPVHRIDPAPIDDFQKGLKPTIIRPIGTVAVPVPVQS